MEKLVEFLELWALLIVAAAGILKILDFPESR